MEEVVVDVGPELFDDEGGGINADVEAPLAAGAAEGAFARGVIEGGDPGSCAGADDFADVEGVVPVVVAGDDGAAEVRGI